MRTVLVLLSLISLGSAGCYRPLFDENLPRHQYESYDTARNGQQPTEEYDLFGNPQPTLRTRLNNR
jgi:hypothetical protein